jgi:hypothetical protein
MFIEREIKKRREREREREREIRGDDKHLVLNLPFGFG